MYEFASVLITLIQDWNMSKKGFLFDSRFRVTKYGKEIEKSALEPHGIYMVHYKLKKDIAEQRSVDEFQWGIIVLDNQGIVYRNYNVRTPQGWSFVRLDLNNGYHVFEPSKEDREFAVNAMKVLNLESRLKRLIESTDDKIKYYQKRQGHWLHKFVDWFIL